MKRAVLFDLFGTLVPSPLASEYRSVVDSVAEVAGLEPDEFFPRWMSINDDRLKGTNRSSEGEIEQAMGLVGVTLSDEQMAECVQMRRDAMRSRLVPRPDCIDMLTRLAGSGVEIALVSDCVHDVPAVWSSTPFADLLTTAIFSCVEGTRKPDPRLYESAMSGLGVTPAESIFIGDGGSNELQGASDLGIDAYLLDDQPADLSTVLRVDIHEWDGPSIRNLSEVPALIARTNNG